MEFPLFWNVASAREWDFIAQQFWWSWVFAHLIGNIADDAVQMEVQKNALSFLHYKENSPCYGNNHKKRFDGSNSQV